MEKNKGHTEIKADIQVRDGFGKAVFVEGPFIEHEVLL
jgi:hypothetical protein